MVVHHAAGLHEGVADGGADNLKPRLSSALLRRSESAVRAWMSDML